MYLLYNQNISKIGSSDLKYLILNVSGSIGYSFRFGFGSDSIHGPKYHKQKPFGIYVGFGFIFIESDSDSFLSDRVRFGFSGSVYLASLKKDTTLIVFV